MTINMGKHLNTAFTGKVSATGWKNASIQLINCGKFFGNTKPGNYSGILDGNSFINSDTAYNFLTITLTPRNGTASTSGLINLTSGISQNLPKTGTSTITIPLYARYIQTENSVTAGIADGRLEYIITYQ